MRSKKWTNEGGWGRAAAAAAMSSKDTNKESYTNGTRRG